MINVDSLSFLIGTFKNVVDNFGANSNSVKFFKTQVDGLISIGQVSNEDASLIYRILGMNNTTAVKWESTTSKMNNFIEVMNYMVTAKTPEQAYKIYTQLKSLEKIPKNIDEYIREIYGFKEATLPNKVNSFGSLNSSNSGSANTSESTKKTNTTQTNKGKAIQIGTGAANNIKDTSCSDYDCTTLEDYNNIDKYLVKQLKAYNDKLYISVKNSQAVCSADPIYFHCRLSELLNGIEYYNSSEIRELLNGSDYEIALKEERDDVCHPSIAYKKLQIVTNDLHKINFKKFYLIKMFLRLVGIHSTLDKAKEIEDIFDVCAFMAKNIDNALLVRYKASETKLVFKDMVKKQFKVGDIRDTLNMLQQEGYHLFIVDQKDIIGRIFDGATAEARCLDLKLYFDSMNKMLLEDYYKQTVNKVYPR